MILKRPSDTIQLLIEKPVNNKVVVMASPRGKVAGNPLWGQGKMINGDTYSPVCKSSARAMTTRAVYVPQMQTLPVLVEGLKRSWLSPTL